MSHMRHGVAVVCLARMDGTGVTDTLCTLQIASVPYTQLCMSQILLLVEMWIIFRWPPINLIGCHSTLLSSVVRGCACRVADYYNTVEIVYTALHCRGIAVPYTAVLFHAVMAQTTHVTLLVPYV